MFTYMPKTKRTIKRPFHLHIEYFFRKQYMLLAVIGLMTIAIAKSDGKMLGGLKDAYAEGFGLIGAYLREETAHRHVVFEPARTPTISGK